VAGGLFLGVAAIRAATHLSATDDTKPAVLVPAAVHCDTAWSKDLIRRGEARGILKGQEIRGIDFVVVVNPIAWNQLNLGAQKAMGLAVACQINDGFAGPKVHFRAFRDGADLMQLSSNDLYPLAAARFAAAPTATAPDGFRDRKWGSKLAPEMTPVNGSDKVYVSKAKPQPFLGVPVDQEDFNFEHRLLFGGDIFVRGAAAWAQLRPALAATYGAPTTADVADDYETYGWSWAPQKVSLAVSYDAKKQSAWVRLAKDQ
jgi:hypothetical protein